MTNYSLSPEWEETIEWFMENPFTIHEIHQKLAEKWPDICENRLKNEYSKSAFYTRYYALLSIFQGRPDDSSLAAKGLASLHKDDDYDYDEDYDYEDEEY